MYIFYFFTHENMKRLPSKLHILAELFFFEKKICLGQDLNPRTTKSPLMQDWVFRLRRVVYVKNWQILISVFTQHSNQQA